ncbi:hypothetical protein [Micromonospora sp. KC213]|uniref:hypothetical protein n=1 Tax=Micromonospora sp. KC213 TaxID=2530378 RepID=UPI001FB7C804|nr:hypothetical protein [Micromonospora sp. KC213]
MTTPSGASPEDDYWRRPPEEPGPASPTSDKALPPPQRDAGLGVGTPDNHGPGSSGNDGLGGSDAQVPQPPARSPWAAPADVPPPVVPVAPATSGRGVYHGPPPTTAPPPGWRPPVHFRATPPRTLPPQDMEAMDAAEQQAQRVTHALGAAAGLVLLVLLCLLCSRALF